MAVFPEQVQLCFTGYLIEVCLDPAQRSGAIWKVFLQRLAILHTYYHDEQLCTKHMLGSKFRKNLKIMSSVINT